MMHRENISTTVITAIENRDDRWHLDISIRSVSGEQFRITYFVPCNFYSTYSIPSINTSMKTSKHSTKHLFLHLLFCLPHSLLLSLFLSLLLSLLLSCVLSGCRFKVPTAKEQDALVAKGSFPSGTPAWLAAANSSGKSTGQSSGLIPLDLSNAFNSRNRQGNVALEASPEEEAAAGKKASSSAHETDDTASEESSPLERIYQKCPAIEQEVKQALLTLERESRIQKWESITKRCRESQDIWLWLGLDYTAVGRLQDASRVLDYGLALDPQNQEILKAIEDLTIRQQREESAG